MELYPYQQRVKTCIQAGRSVILQAPTGTGKTRAALAPFIEAFFDLPAHAFPRKCIYSVPMRVLANQFEEEFSGLAARYQRRFRRPLTVTIQTGERPEDPMLTGDLIFATIDQTLSSALAVPYSLSPKRANMNAAAVYSAYLVFDEFHLFPVEAQSGAGGALVTTLQLLAALKGIVPFVLMTATFSSTMLADLATRLDAEVITVTQGEYLQIASGNGKKPRRRHYYLHQEPLTAEAVLSAHAEPGVSRSLVVCNQVGRAQELFQALRERTQGTGIQVRLLHSRFTQADRQQKEVELAREFGKAYSERRVESLILVATQVVEVGLDITCDRLHTEVAPANAILQRAGRCARYPGEEGHVHIYPVPARPGRDGEPQPDYLPYPASLCEVSWQSFQKRHGQEIDFQEEQAIIDEVHTEMDRQLLKAMDQQQGLLWREIFGAMEEHDPSQRQKLIRRIDSITVLAAPQPEAVGNPFTAQGFSLHRGSVYRIWRELEEYSQMVELGEFEDFPWLMAYPQPVDNPEEDIAQEERFAWRKIRDRDLLNASSVVVINSAFCAYDAEVGFRIVPPGTASPWASPPGEFRHGRRGGEYLYTLESYQQHIQRMLQIYQRPFNNQQPSLRESYAYIQQRLGKSGALAPDSLDRAIRLAITCHDLGKLDKGWQRWVRLYQEAIGKPIQDAHFMAVHTDWNPADPACREAKQLADRRQKRPRHAGESAVAAARIVVEQCGQPSLTRAALTAIARHHSPTTADYTPYELHPGAQPALLQALEQAGLSQPTKPLTTKGPGGPLDRILIQPEQFEQLLLYFYIVRVLRLCDGLSQEME
ncbi:CRISPR-associated helicase Cas3' [Litorilinea aerophila]|uniref:CRISPR-associated helicase Cas3 n=1 Tax=Litorilinea aerophila TaxID=1204385 RepID=A0A540VD14_9CHLR|nr:CRISPR-associated helicase Cas3' [Litorilinea aerophila]MCC9077514.1 CRISPR-associated helicase Cas3' [Litorilinea aerophila]GIV79353.1 MAG: CRISPR-associated helicase/endonuclease Cas3 [Litorilinea sp.]